MMYRQNVTGITTSDRYTALYIGTFNNMSTYTRVGVVTGANKVYIGLAIVRQLALQYPKSSLNNGPFLIWYVSPMFSV
jgi:hypothetical protein